MKVSALSRFLKFRYSNWMVPLDRATVLQECARRYIGWLHPLGGSVGFLFALIVCVVSHNAFLAQVSLTMNHADIKHELLAAMTQLLDERLAKSTSAQQVQSHQERQRYTTPDVPMSARSLAHQSFGGSTLSWRSSGDSTLSRRSSGFSTVSDQTLDYEESQYRDDDNLDAPLSRNSSDASTASLNSSGSRKRKRNFDNVGEDVAPRDYPQIIDQRELK